VVCILAVPINNETNSLFCLLINIIGNKYLYIGGFLYVLAALFNIWILKRMPYSVVVPLGSICYIWTMLIAGIFLKEKRRIIEAISG
jgi:drug/metabolite transporter (DMT)-like permease